MNKIISLDEFLDSKDFFIAEAKAGKIFVYPTDTVYGIGGIYNSENTEKIYAIKKRDETTVLGRKKMFSIIAPSFDRVKANYATDKTIEQLQTYLDNYHGVTYIFDYARPGVRIIKHPFQTFVEKLGLPFITTSCNITGEPTVDSIEKIPSDISSEVDYIIDGGVRGGRRSVLIDFEADKIIQR